MSHRYEKGTWVEIHNIVLPAGERAPQVPEDTQQTPLEMRVKGYLIESAALGDVTEVETVAGRRVRGTLLKVNPPYSHGFGKPVPELTCIGKEVRTMLRDKGWLI